MIKNVNIIQIDYFLEYYLINLILPEGSPVSIKALHCKHSSCTASFKLPDHIEEFFCENNYSSNGTITGKFRLINSLLSSKFAQEATNINTYPDFFADLRGTLITRRIDMNVDEKDDVEEWSD